MDSQQSSLYFVLPLSLCISFTASSVALAENTNTDQPDKKVYEIVITPSFRPVALKDSNASISVITEEKRVKRGAQHIESVLNTAPNVNMASGASRAHYFQIRGIGERSQFKAPINPSVGLVIDGVELSRSGASATLFDIQQVEVVRGPQGTKYGANALAGLINLKSTQPSSVAETHVEASMAGFNTRSFGIATGGALVKESLFSRFSLHQFSSDGHITNAHLGREDTNNRNELTARGHLKWFANDNLVVDMNFLHLDIDNGYDAFNFTNDRTTFSDQPGKDTQKTDAFSLSSTWDMSNAVRMEASTSYSDTDLEYSYDEDWSYVGEFDEALFPYASFDQYLRNRKNRSMELRLLSNPEGKLFNSKSDWVAGLYYADKTEDFRRNYTYLDEAFSSEYDTSNLALYGQLDTQLNAKLKLITGLRVEKWDANYIDSTGNTIESDEILKGGKLGLEYALNEAHWTYASLSRGFKAGGVNTDGTLPNEVLDFGTEYLWNLELGVNSSWMNNALSTRVSAFYAKRKDQQVKSSIVTPRESGVTQFDDFIRNAAEGRNYGLEAELDWAVNSRWDISASLGLLEARFDKYDDPVGVANGLDLSGRDQAHAPRYQYSLGTEYQITPYLSAGLNIEGKSEFFFSDRHDEKAASYRLFNANLAYKKASWTATLWGRNLFDKDYDVRGFGSFGNNPGNGYAVEKYTQKGEPRVVGITVTYDF